MALNRLAQLLPLRAQAAGFAMLLLTYLAAADDYNLRHLLQIDTKEVNFRADFSLERHLHLWRREDYKTTAEFVNARMQKDDVVASTTRASRFYLKRLDYVYMEVQAPEFRSSVGCGGERELWTNARLIYRHDDMLEMLGQNNVPVWLITRSGRFPWRNSVELAVAERFRAQLQYRGLGGGIDVYKIEPR
jgi:hypothetical protein